MADGPYPLIRPEVRQYLKACEHLMGGTDGAHDQFLDASEALQRKSGPYNDEELVVIQKMVGRVCETLGNDYRQ